MARAGVTRWPRSTDGLLRTLDLVTASGEARDGAIAAGRSMFLGDAAKELLDLAARRYPTGEPAASFGAVATA
jgi:hypothetical protein